VKTSVRKYKWNLDGYLKTLQKFTILYLLLTNPSVQIQLLKTLVSIYLFSVNVMFSVSDELIFFLVNCIRNLAIHVSVAYCEIVTVSSPSSHVDFLNSSILSAATNASTWLGTIKLILSGDIETNPGPVTFAEGETCYCYWGNPSLLYKVKLIDSNTVDGKPEYLVHYFGYKDNRNEWVGVDVLLKDCHETVLLKCSLDELHRPKRKGSSGNLTTSVPPVVSNSTVVTSSVSSVTSSGASSVNCISSAPAVTAFSTSINSPITTSVTISGIGPDPSPSLPSTANLVTPPVTLNVSTVTSNITSSTVSSVSLVSDCVSSHTSGSSVSDTLSSPKASTCTTDSLTNPICASSISNLVGITNRTCCSYCKDSGQLLSALQTKLDQHILTTDIKLRELQDANASLVAEITVLRSLHSSESNSDSPPSGDSDLHSNPAPLISEHPSSSRGPKHVTPCSHPAAASNSGPHVTGSRATMSNSRTRGTQAHDHVTRRAVRFRSEIFGDSIVRNTGSLLTTPDACVFPRGGARIADIRETVNGLSKEAIRETNSILFHVGSNDLHLPLRSIMQDFDKLLTLTKSRFPMAHIAISAPLLRSDVPVQKVIEVNNELQILCRDYGVDFIDVNPCFTSSDFSDGVHLKEYAKIRLARSFDVVFSNHVAKNGSA
jgi:hypothetical protein